jgi:hypothetical protein
MKLEDQVVSLELARKLKELGVKQESVFYWRENRLIARLAEFDLAGRYPDSQQDISAFTGTEIVEQLPAELLVKGNNYIWFLEIKKHLSGYIVNYYQEGVRLTDEVFHEKKEADACTKILIYLLENDLLPHPEKGEGV